MFKTILLIDAKKAVKPPTILESGSTENSNLWESKCQNIRCQSQYLRRDTGLGNTGEIRAFKNNSDLWRAAIRHDSRVGVG